MCLDEVVVTGTRTRCPMKNISIPIRVVSPKEIEAVQARSVEDLLQMVIPGVQADFVMFSRFTNDIGIGMTNLFTWPGRTCQ